MRMVIAVPISCRAYFRLAVRAIAVAALAAMLSLPVVVAAAPGAGLVPICIGGEIRLVALGDGFPGATEDPREGAGGSVPCPLVLAGAALASAPGQLIDVNLDVTAAAPLRRGGQADHRPFPADYSVRGPPAGP